MVGLASKVGGVGDDWIGGVLAGIPGRGFPAEYHALSSDSGETSIRLAHLHRSHSTASHSR